MEKKNRVNKYIPARLQLEEKKNRERKNHIVGIHYELFDIYIYIYTHTLSLSLH